MQAEQIVLGTGGTLPPRLLSKLRIQEKEPLTLISGKEGFLLLKKDATLTDMLSHLLSPDDSDWDESEYGEYLLQRTE